MNHNKNLKLRFIIIILLMFIIIAIANSANAVSFARQKNIFNFEVSRVGDGETPIEVTGVNLNNSNLNLNIDDSSTLIATVLPNDATNKKLIWSSDDESVAEVDQQGNVTANSKGIAVITVKTEDGEFEKDCLVKVDQTVVAVTGVMVDMDELNMFVGDEEYLIAIVFPNNATNKKIIWSSSNQDVATVTTGGTITAIGVGTAVITAKTEDGNYTSSCSVKVGNSSEGVSTIVLDSDYMQLMQNETKKLTATITPSTVTGVEFQWLSQNTAVAIVDANGYVTGISAGETEIICKTADGKIASGCVVTVIENNTHISVTGIKITQKEISIKPGRTYQLAATVEPINANEKCIEWYSMDSDVATVTEDGLVTGVSEGNTTVRVRTEEGGFTDYCTVHVSASASEIGGTTSTILATGLSLNKTTATIKAGATVTLKPVFTPINVTNQKIIWSSSNTKIVKVTETGLVIGVDEGEAIISALSEDGNFIALCNIKVSGFITEEDEKNNNGISDEDITLIVNPYSILSGKKIIRRIPINTSVTDFLSYIQTNVTKILYTSTKSKMQSNSIVGTGCYLKLNNSVIYKLIVTGDLNGDGKLTAVDLSKLKGRMVKLIELTEEFEMAGDTNQDGKITAVDLSRLKQACVGAIEL